MHGIIVHNQADIFCIAGSVNSVLGNSLGIVDMAEPVAVKKKNPAVLKHYETPGDLPTGEYVKLKCKYCSKEITGSTKATTNWWKHLVS